jgi:hypothetical protein
MGEVGVGDAAAEERVVERNDGAGDVTVVGCELELDGAGC